MKQLTEPWWVGKWYKCPKCGSEYLIEKNDKPRMLNDRNEPLFVCPRECRGAVGDIVILPVDVEPK